MNRLKALGLVLVSAFAGAAIAMAATPVRAQFGQSQPPRLTVTGQPYESHDSFGNRLPAQPFYGSWQFISDSKSGGCWLLIKNEGDQRTSVLAPAPSAACQQ